jgi:integrase
LGACAEFPRLGAPKMPKIVPPLSDIQVKAAKPKEKPYKLADGHGLYLEVTPTGSKLWRMKFRQANGKESRLSFGSYPTVPLVQARKLRDEAREQKVSGIDPAKFKRERKRATVAAAANTFEAVARQWLSNSAANRAKSTQEKNANWLEKNVFPHIGKSPISEIRSLDVLAAVRVMEARGAIASAHRVKQLCGKVFRYAVATGYCDRDVTTDLRDALAAIPKGNFAAITEPAQAGALLRSISSYIGHPYAVAALKLAPLVFVRPGELRTAEWGEIDLDTATWRIPGTKMKMKVEHVVPLSRQAVQLLREIRTVSGDGKYVFPSIRTDARCMSENTINAALRGMGYSKEVMTGHGFRAMARTIMDEVLGERVDLIEHQLAHAVKDPNGRAYNRTAHLPARRQMMQRWADYLDRIRVGAEVIQGNFGAA